MGAVGRGEDASWRPRGGPGGGLWRPAASGLCYFDEALHAAVDQQPRPRRPIRRGGVRPRAPRDVRGRGRAAPALTVREARVAGHCPLPTAHCPLPAAHRPPQPSPPLAPVRRAMPSALSLHLHCRRARPGKAGRHAVCGGRNVLSVHAVAPRREITMAPATATAAVRDGRIGSCHQQPGQAQPSPAQPSPAVSCSCRCRCRWRPPDARGLRRARALSPRPTVTTARRRALDAGHRHGHQARRWHWPPGCHWAATGLPVGCQWAGRRACHANAIPSHPIPSWPGQPRLFARRTAGGRPTEIGSQTIFPPATAAANHGGHGRTAWAGCWRDAQRVTRRRGGPAQRVDDMSLECDG